MVVSHARRFIFFHNPKCAGTSLRETLDSYHDDPIRFWGIRFAPYFRNRIDHGHLRLWEIHALFPDAFACTQAYNSVIVVRNPYARFLAAVNEHFKKFQPQIDLASMPPAQRASVAAQFVTKVLDIGRITTDWRFVHFSPQLWQVKIGGRIVPRHIIPMDRDGTFPGAVLAALDLPASEIPRRNESPVDLSACLQSEVVRRFVEAFYADDFAFFRERDGLADLCQMPDPE